MGLVETHLAACKLPNSLFEMSCRNNQQDLFAYPDVSSRTMPIRRAMRDDASPLAASCAALSAVRPLSQRRPLPHFAPFQSFVFQAPHRHFACFAKRNVCILHFAFCNHPSSVVCLPSSPNNLLQYPPCNAPFAERKIGKVRAFVKSAAHSSPRSARSVGASCPRTPNFAIRAAFVSPTNRAPHHHYRRHQRPQHLRHHPMRLHRLRQRPRRFLPNHPSHPAPPRCRMSVRACKNTFRKNCSKNSMLPLLVDI